MSVTSVNVLSPLLRHMMIAEPDTLGEYLLWQGVADP